MDLEIMEFIRPDAPQHSLYITSISSQLDHNTLYKYLLEKFSPFGIIYEVQVIDANDITTQPRESTTTHHTVQTDVASNPVGSYYAFVKFYSMKSAAKAKKELTARLFVGGQHMRIRYSTRAAPDEPVPLYYTKCFELANHYLGFNGWSISIIMCKENTEHSIIQPNQVQYVSGIKLSLPQHGLTTEGYGVATTSHDQMDPCTKSVAICRAKKQSYQQAVQNAYQRLLLVVLDNGKVYADVNGTIEDRIYCDEQLTMENLLEVKELDINPRTPDEDDTVNDSIDIDIRNQQLLEDLEFENS